MENIQKEALRRMQEMHSKAKYPSKEPPCPVNNEKPNCTDKKEDVVCQNINHECRENSSDVISNILFKDKEKTLILALIALLATEKADIGLILALMYIVI